MATGMWSSFPIAHSLTPAVRICLCGDDGVGKSSIITSLVKDVFVTAKIQPVLPQVTLPPTLGTPDNVTTTIVDTSALPHERHTLRTELRKSNVILLVYSDHYSYERVALFWMPYFRSLGVNVPVVLCANKSDIASMAQHPKSCRRRCCPS
jgi:Ras family protein T1